MHDILQKAFPELQLIFLHYSGSSMMGAASVQESSLRWLHVRTLTWATTDVGRTLIYQAATKVGMAEMLSFARETQIPTKEFKMEEVQRHFTAANAEAKIAASGSADRKKLGKTSRAAFGKSGSSLDNENNAKEAKKERR